MKFIIKINPEQLEFEADDKEEAEDLAVDILDDISHDGEYQIEEVKTK